MVSVNDAPSFTAGASQAVLEDSGAQTFAGWGTDLAVGPANEASQVGAFVLSNDNPSLFAAEPAVSATGELSFTPADAPGTFRDPDVFDAPGKFATVLPIPRDDVSLWK